MGVRRERGLDAQLREELADALERIYHLNSELAEARAQLDAMQPKPHIRVKAGSRPSV
jgi:hypothetical protein